MLTKTVSAFVCSYAACYKGSWGAGAFDVGKTNGFAQIGDLCGGPGFAGAHGQSVKREVHIACAAGVWIPQHGFRNDEATTGGQGRKAFLQQVGDRGVRMIVEDAHEADCVSAGWKIRIAEGAGYDLTARGEAVLGESGFGVGGDRG